MITDRQFHALWGKALDAVEGKSAAEQQTREAQQAAARALENAEKARIAADKTKAAADAFARDRKAEQDKIDAELAAVRTREKAQHEASLANTQKHEAEASGRFEALQSQIVQHQKHLDEIKAEIAKHRAALADFAAKF